MSRTKGYKCFNIKCGSCIGKTLCGEPEDTALVCVDRVIGKPMTNADRIRAMSDEELAMMLKDYKDCSKNCIISNGKHCYQICEEESVLLKWLQQPAEEDDND